MLVSACGVGLAWGSRIWLQTHVQTHLHRLWFPYRCRSYSWYAFVCWRGELQSIRIKFSTDKQTWRPIRTTAASNWAHLPSRGLQRWGHLSLELDYYLCHTHTQTRTHSCTHSSRYTEDTDWHDVFPSPFTLTVTITTKCLTLSLILILTLTKISQE